MYIWIHVKAPFLHSWGLCCSRAVMILHSTASTLVLDRSPMHVQSATQYACHKWSSSIFCPSGGMSEESTWQTKLQLWQLPFSIKISVAFFKRSQKFGQVIILKTFPIIFVHFILPQRLDRGKKLKLYHNNNIAYMVYF